jgi:hypothetical protein
MKEAQFEWGRGAVQKEQTQQAMEQLQAMADVSVYLSVCVSLSAQSCRDVLIAA